MSAPTTGDWARFFALVAFWGTAFAFTKIAVATIAPAGAVALRLWIASALLIAWCAHNRETLPALFPRPDPLWVWLFALGFFGNAAPFFLIAEGQVRVDSGLAAILTSTMPLATAALAHVFVAGEHLTWRKSAGMVLGFVGVVILVGPTALSEIGADTLAQLAILAGAMCYAVNVIVARRAPEVSARVVGTGMVVAAAILMTPLGAWELARAPAPSLASLGATVALGIGATAAASIVYVQLVRSAGPSFLAQANYLTPLTAVAVGWFMGERLPLSALAALAVILLGLWLGTAGSRSGSAPGSIPPPRPRS